MKKADKISYREKSSAELEKQAFELQKSLVENRVKLSNGSLKDSSVIKKIRQQIAMIKTYINQHQNDKKSQ